MQAVDWDANFESELRRGLAAREAGNEGMARVCARRAAGILVREHYRRLGRPLPAGSVLNQLRVLSESSDQLQSVREAAAHFFLRITTDHVLPEDVDLLADARWLRRSLLPDSDFP